MVWGLLLAAGCQQTPAPPPAAVATPSLAVLRIGITTSAAAFADLVAEPYHQQTDNAILHFVPANTETLLKDLAAGQLDAVLVHHLPLDSDFWFNPVALDGLVIVVHPDNPVSNLGREEVQAIFNGRLSNWSAVGGPALPITLISREPGAGTRAIFQQRIMAEQRIHINTIIEPGHQALVTAVAADAAAVGYSMMGAAGGVKALAIDGISSSPAETARQNYPLTAPLYFVAATEPQGELRTFLAWLQSPAGQEVVGQQYGRVR